MPKSVSTRSAYKMLTCIYLCRTLLFFAPYADFSSKKEHCILNNENINIQLNIMTFFMIIQFNYYLISSFTPNMNVRD